MTGTARMGCVLVLLLVAAGCTDSRTRPYLELDRAGFAVSGEASTLVAPKGDSKRRIGNWRLQVEGEAAGVGLRYTPFGTEPSLQLVYESTALRDDLDVVEAFYQANNDTSIPLEIQAVNSNFDENVPGYRPGRQRYTIRYYRPPGFDHQMMTSSSNIGYGWDWLEEQGDLMHRFRFVLQMDGQSVVVDVSFTVQTERVRYWKDGVPGMP